MTERFIHTNFLARQRVKRSKKSGQMLPLGIIGMGLSVLLLFFGFLWVRIYVLEVGYQLSEALEAGKTLEEENRQLRIERASLSAPARIENIARTKLGMVEPNNSQVITLRW